MRNLFIMVCLFASFGLQAQTIKGRVMEETADGEEPLAGANVYWVGTSKGAVTDGNGEFKLKWGKVGNQLHRLSVGYYSSKIDG